MWKILHLSARCVATDPAIHHTHKGYIFWLSDVSHSGISNHDKSRLSTMSCSFVFSFVLALWLLQWQRRVGKLNWAHQMLKPVLFICVHGNEATICFCVWIPAYFMGVSLRSYGTPYLFIGSACSLARHDWFGFWFFFCLICELFINAPPRCSTSSIKCPFVKQFLLIC